MPVWTTHSNHDSTVPLMTFRRFQGNHSVIVTTHMSTNSMCYIICFDDFLCWVPAQPWWCQMIWVFLICHWMYSMLQPLVSQNWCPPRTCCQTRLDQQRYYVISPKIGWREKLQNPLDLETNKHGFLQSLSSNESIESHEIVGKRAMLCKESSIMMMKTWILSQNRFDTLVSSTVIFCYEWYI